LGISIGYGQFVGGNASGHSALRIINSICAITTVNPFAGGISDGHANARMINSVCAITTVNPFSGGASDGHANSKIINTICAITTINPFSGGASDGHANARVINSICPITTINPFSGGIADGHANVRMVNSVCPITTTNPFSGGGSEGNANLRLVNVIPSLCIPTPIDLISFDASCDGQKVILNWVTASEKNNDYFTIERGIKPAELTAIGTSKGAGNSTMVLSYKFIDPSPIVSNDKIIYYRLSQTDYDGKSERFNIISLQECNSIKERFSVQPNPTNGMISLDYSGSNDDVISVEIYTLLGERIYYREAFQSKIDISPFSSGMYLVYLKTGSGLIYEKIVLNK